MVFREVIRIGVGKVSVLVANAAQLVATAVHYLEAVLTIPIAVCGNLNIDKLVTTVSTSDKDRRRANVPPDFFGPSDMAVNFVRTDCINNAKVVLKNILASREPRFWGHG